MQNPNGSPIAFSAAGMYEVTKDDVAELPKHALALRLEGVEDGDTLKVQFYDDSEITLNLTEADNGEKAWLVKKVFNTGSTPTVRVIAIL
jgi:hypothetical protein